MEKKEPFWDKKYGKNSICGITLTRLRPGKNKNGISYIVKTKCNHLFYRSALNKWLENNNSCPTCRQKF